MRFDPVVMVFLLIFAPCVSFIVHNTDRPHLRFYVPYTVFKLIQNNNRPCFCVANLSRSLSLPGRAPIVYRETRRLNGEHDEALSYYIGHSRVLVVLSLLLTNAFREQRPEEKTNKVSQSLFR